MIEKNFIQEINEVLTEKYCIQADMLRIDLLHPVVSGNKLYKLHYFLAEALEKKKKGIITIGGAFSNHLVATAFAAKEKGLQSIGYVRAESHEPLTITLQECLSYGMNIKYISRKDYNQLNQHLLEDLHPEFLFIPQGGYGELGAKGASDIINKNNTRNYTHILAACGTGTMGAGLINAAESHQQITLISALKNNFSILEEIEELLTEEGRKIKHQVLFQYHMGGYAKKNDAIFTSMNQFFNTHGIPTDFVYTGKLVYAYYELLQNNFFEKGAKVLLIHSGGLQGNRSLLNGELIF